MQQETQSNSISHQERGLTLVEENVSGFMCASRETTTTPMKKRKGKYGSREKNKKAKNKDHQPSSVAWTGKRANSRVAHFSKCSTISMAHPTGTTEPFTSLRQTTAAATEALHKFCILNFYDTKLLISKRKRIYASDRYAVAIL